MVQEAEMRERQTGVYEDDKGSKGRATHHLSLILNPRHTLHDSDDICKGANFTPARPQLGSDQVSGRQV